MGRRILITGGAGFIGSHTCLVLLEQGHELVVLDNFCNSSPKALRRVQELAGSTQLTLVKGDVRDASAVNQAFSSGGAVDGVIHFAGLKSVAESVLNPMKYWENNLIGSYNLIKSMSENNCTTIVFSSSATVYGNTSESLIKESSKIKPINPYGSTKYAVENLLNDIFTSKNFYLVESRYFWNKIKNFD